MKKLILLFFLLVPNSKEAVPTPEGLFRNGHNRDVTGNLIILDLMIQETSEEEKESTQNPTGIMYYRFFIEVKENNVRSLLQVIYNKASMKKQDRIQVDYFKNFQQSFDSDTSIERKLFYSLLIMMTTNSSSFWTNLLKSMGQGHKTNRELMNHLKISLYEQYKNYLIKKRQQGTASEGLTSPLEPVRNNQKAKIRKILNARTYFQSPLVSLVKRETDFFWKVALNNVVFFFTNEEHRFSELLFNDPVGEITIQAKRYFRPDGIHEMPKYIRFSSLNGKHYKIRTLALNHFNSRKAMASRAKSLRVEKPTGYLLTVPFIF